MANEADWVEPLTGHYLVAESIKNAGIDQLEVFKHGSGEIVLAIGLIINVSGARPD
ncbi:hypothetical protein NKH82_04330 [Mesorhizobium sp. M0915]|uniref:hypothetical protein n=1 Tax=Mesorhizobium sp. M0915 TaxID=2957027 RepID=UPI0033360268